ncbi:MAG: hypothetical protein K8H88_18040 [Sandaracinaceae bacterium]|nr:hypothetical protein [Sandaracinaceae bacterium]
MSSIGILVAAGEECEDGNDVAGDGCENDCTFTCEADGECPDDGESCNGSPVCDTTAHTCGTSTPPDTGAACTSASGAPGTCQAMVCVAAGCGNMIVDEGEDCDDGNTNDADGCTRMCTFTCVSNAQCSDNNVCNGIETCTLATHRCQTGTGMLCRDTSACTTDTCNPITGCVFTLIDADGDGHAATSLGACGDDCNDANPNVYTGHSEICMDGLDNDCNGTVDDGLTTWFADCDGDGYGATGAAARPPRSGSRATRRRDPTATTPSRPSIPAPSRPSATSATTTATRKRSAIATGTATDTGRPRP